MTEIARIQTNVPNLEKLLGDGIPKYSVNIIAGQPGTGKTILANQITFNHIRSHPQARALLLTTLSEPVMKMVRYMQQFTFFDEDQFSERIICQDIGGYIREHELPDVVNHIEELIFDHNPEILLIDSFKAIGGLARNEYDFRRFCFDLSIRLATARCTTFWVGEYDKSDIARGPEFGVADGILYQEISEAYGEVIRHISVYKLRGQAADLSATPFLISQEGIRVLGPQSYFVPENQPTDIQPAFIPTGISGLDILLRGGLLPGRCVLLSGVSGTGKTTMALQFLVNGVLEKRKGILFSFEESKPYLYRLASGFGWNLGELEEQGLLRVIYIPQNEIRTEEHMDYMSREIVDFCPERIAVDSFSGFLYKVKDISIQREKTFQMASVVRGVGGQAVLISDVPASEANRLSRFGVEETVLDGTIALSSEMVGLNRRRYIEVIKMRGVKNVAGRYRMEINDEGAEVLISQPTNIKPSRIPAPFNFEPVKHMFKGSLRYGSAWLVRGMPGVGKSTLALQYAIQILQRKESVLYVAIDAPPPEIIQALNNMSFLPEPYLETGQLDIMDAFSSHEGGVDLTDPDFLLYSILRRAEKMDKPLVLVLDSLSPVSLGYQSDDFVSLIHRKNRLFAAPDVALFDTLLSGTMESDRLYSLVNAYDVVVDLYVPDWGEMKFAGNTGYRAIQLYKARGTNVDSRPYPYFISPNDGLVVQKDFYRD